MQLLSATLVVGSPWWERGDQDFGTQLPMMFANSPAPIARVALELKLNRAGPKFTPSSDATRRG